jgi:hypothetical protein
MLMVIIIINYGGASVGNNINAGAITSGTLSVSRGGTGLATLTDGGVVLGDAANALDVTARPTSGQAIVGQASGNPLPKAVTLKDGGGDVTFANAVMNNNGDISAIINVNDDSHNHIVSNVDGLQTALDGKSGTSHVHDHWEYVQLQDLVNKSGVAWSFSDNNLIQAVFFTSDTSLVYFFPSVSRHIKGVRFRLGTSPDDINSVNLTLRLKDAVDGSSSFTTRFTATKTTTTLGYQTFTGEGALYSVGSTRKVRMELELNSISTSAPVTFTLMSMQILVECSIHD